MSATPITIATRQYIHIGRINDSPSVTAPSPSGVESGVVFPAQDRPVKAVPARKNSGCRLPAPSRTRLRIAALNTSLTHRESAASRCPVTAVRGPNKQDARRADNTHWEAPRTAWDTPLASTSVARYWVVSRAGDQAGGTRSQGPSNTLRAHFILDFDLCFTRKFGSI
jgi:hypothetical protein